MSRIFGSAMSALFMLVVIAGCALFLSNTSRGATSDQIQIGTYNLEFLTDLDPSTGAWCSQHTKHTAANIKALAAFIDSLGIEVLALQEVGDAKALDMLLSYMPANKYACIVSRQADQCQPVAVLYQPKKVSLTYAEEIPLNSPGHHYLRNGLVVDGKVLPDGFDFTLVDVHMKAYFDAESEACEQKKEFHCLYPLDWPIEKKVEKIAREVYNANGVVFSGTARAQIERYTQSGFADLPICMAKTHLSISHDPNLKGVPRGYTLPVREVRASVGAGFIYPLCGEMRTMPGLPSQPAFMHIDLDENGEIVGLS